MLSPFSQLYLIFIFLFAFLFFELLRGLVVIGCTSVPPGSTGPDLGLKEHEDLPAGQRLLPQPGGGMRRRGGAHRRHQELQEEPKLPRLRAAAQSGIARSHFNTSR